MSEKRSERGGKERSGSDDGSGLIQSVLVLGILSGISFIAIWTFERTRGGTVFVQSESSQPDNTVVVATGAVLAVLGLLAAYLIVRRTSRSRRAETTYAETPGEGSKGNQRILTLGLIAVMVLFLSVQSPASVSVVLEKLGIEIGAKNPTQPFSPLMRDIMGLLLVLTLSSTIVGLAWRTTS